MKIKIFRDNSGLTLVELMIVMVLSIVLMGAVYMAHQAQHVSSQSQYQTSSLQSELRVAMDIMQMDIVNAGCDRCIMDTFDIQGVNGASTSTFLGLSMNYDTCVAPAFYNPYSAQYMLSGSGLWRSDSDGSNSQIIQNITTFGLTYIDEDGNTITASPLGSTANDVYYIRINITVESPDVDPSTGNRITRNLSRTVALRNANYKSSL